MNTAARAEYWAAQCKTPRCEKMIAFDVVRYDAKSKKIDPSPIVEVFEGTCEAGHRSEYIMNELFVWQGPVSLGFRPQPDFVREKKKEHR